MAFNENEPPYDLSDYLNAAVDLTARHDLYAKIHEQLSMMQENPSMFSQAEMEAAIEAFDAVVGLMPVPHVEPKYYLVDDGYGMPRVKFNWTRTREDIPED